MSFFSRSSDKWLWEDKRKVAFFRGSRYLELIWKNLSKPPDYYQWLSKQLDNEGQKIHKSYCLQFS